MAAAHAIRHTDREVAIPSFLPRPSASPCRGRMRVRRIQNGMIHIFNIVEDFDAAAGFRAVMPLIPKWRLDKAMAYRFDIDRFLCAKSFMLLEEMLRQDYGLGCCPEFSYGDNGKPYFRDYPDIFFSISHCHKGIACAVMDRPVGIDIEEIQYDEELAKAIFNAEELEAVRGADDPAEKFTEFWTRKESFLKLTGEGLRDNLKDVLSGADEATITTGINRPAGYVYSTAIWKQDRPAGQFAIDCDCHNSYDCLSS